MRRKRGRLLEQLTTATLSCLTVYVAWVWARVTPPASAAVANDGLPYTLKVVARTLADSLMPLVLIGTPVIVIAWLVLIRRSRDELRRHHSAVTLRGLSPDRFEDWCAARFRELGYRVQIVGGPGDHGIDLVATRGAERVGIQCRRFAQNNAVTEPQLRDLYGAMHSMGATRAVMVTTGRYTASAREWVRGKPVDLWGPEEFSLAAPNHPIGPLPGGGLSKVADLATAGGSRLGACPISHSALAIRTNRRTGEQFVGCTDYPRCKYVRSLQASEQSRR